MEEQNNEEVPQLAQIDVLLAGQDDRIQVIAHESALYNEMHAYFRRRGITHPSAGDEQEALDKIMQISYWHDRHPPQGIFITRKGSAHATDQHRRVADQAN